MKSKNILALALLAGVGAQHGLGEPLFGRVIPQPTRNSTILNYTTARDQRRAAKKGKRP